MCENKRVEDQQNRLLNYPKNDNLRYTCTYLPVNVFNNLSDDSERFVYIF